MNTSAHAWRRWRPTNRNDKPSHRVASAMERLTRDFYMPPEKVQTIGLRLSRCASKSAWANVMKSGVGETSQHVGMLKGNPVCNVWEEKYAMVLVAVKTASKKGAGYELAILKAMR